MLKKIINGIEITDETFSLVTAEEFDKTLDLISNEKHNEYSGYVEVNSFDEIDFVPSCFTDDITDGKRYAMLSFD